MNEQISADDEIKRRTVIATGQLTKLNNIWRNKQISSLAINVLTTPVVLDSFDYILWLWNMDSHERHHKPIECIRENMSPAAPWESLEDEKY